MTPKPHGPGMDGATHSHSVEYPDDNWNLYSMLEPSSTALNTTFPRPEEAIGVLKPHAQKLSPNPVAISDADAEMIFILRFISPVHIRKIMVIGSGNREHHPSQLKCYVNQDVVDFSNVSSLNPVQEFNLNPNEDGTIELITVIRPFTNVSTLVLYFPQNFGEVDQTRIQYIGLQGEHTHYRREAVDTVYEVLCNGQDIIQPESDPSHTHSHGHEHSHAHDHSH
jgi:hypothetical protein